MDRGFRAHRWALTHTEAQGQTYQPLSSLFLSSGVSGLQRSLLHEDCLLRSTPTPDCASSSTVMPSRQLHGGSCLDHLKADGWAGIRCHPPGNEEAALLLRPGYRLRQMDRLSRCPHAGPGGVPVPQQRSSSGQPPVGPLNKGLGSALHLLRGVPIPTLQPHHLSEPWDPTTAPTPPYIQSLHIHTHSSNTSLYTITPRAQSQLQHFLLYSYQHIYSKLQPLLLYNHSIYTQLQALFLYSHPHTHSQLQYLPKHTTTSLKTHSSNTATDTTTLLTHTSPSTSSNTQPLHIQTPLQHPTPPHTHTAPTLPNNNHTPTHLSATLLQTPRTQL